MLQICASLTVIPYLTQFREMSWNVNKKHSVLSLLIFISLETENLTDYQRNECPDSLG